MPNFMDDRTEITITVTDEELARILHMPNDKAHIGIAQGIVHWDEIERYLRQKVLQRISWHDIEVHMATSQTLGRKPDLDKGEKGNVGSPIWCEFRMMSKREKRAKMNDIRPILDEMPAHDLPDGVDAIWKGALDYGNDLVVAAKEMGLLSPNALEIYDMDEDAYAEYLEERRRLAGLDGNES